MEQQQTMLAVRSLIGGRTAIRVIGRTVVEVSSVSTGRGVRMGADGPLMVEDGVVLGLADLSDMESLGRWLRTQPQKVKS